MFVPPAVDGIFFFVKLLDRSRLTDNTKSEQSDGKREDGKNMKNTMNEIHILKFKNANYASFNSSIK